MNEVTSTSVTDYKLKLQQTTGQPWSAVLVKAQADGSGNAILSRHDIILLGLRGQATSRALRMSSR